MGLVGAAWMQGLVRGEVQAIPRAWVFDPPTPHSLSETSSPRFPPSSFLSKRVFHFFLCYYFAICLSGKAAAGTAVLTTQHQLPFVRSLTRIHTNPGHRTHDPNPPVRYNKGGAKPSQRNEEFQKNGKRRTRDIQPE